MKNRRDLIVLFTALKNLINTVATSFM